MDEKISKKNTKKNTKKYWNFRATIRLSEEALFFLQIRGFLTKSGHSTGLRNLNRYLNHLIIKDTGVKPGDSLQVIQQKIWKRRMVELNEQEQELKQEMLVLYNKIQESKEALEKSRKKK